MTGPLHASTLGGPGPRVVLLHGLFGQGKNWTSLGRSLATEVRVLLPDLPDHGRSPWSDAVSYPAMAEAVAERLADGSAEPWTVVGHSMGGKVAMALALLQPQVVGRLCVVDVSPVATEQLGGFARYVEGMRAVDLQRLPDRAAADSALLPYVPDPVIRSFLLQNLRRADGGWHWQMNLRLLGDQLDRVADWPDLTAPPYRASPYGGPVLWVAGAESRYITPEHAPAMRALFPRVQTVTVKGAGHWVHADRPEVFGAILRRFLGLAPASTGDRAVEPPAGGARRP